LILKQVLEIINQWTLQVAGGMLYLSGRKIIYADLAVKNLLLLTERDVEITDIGLTRQLRKYTIYKKLNRLNLYKSRNEKKYFSIL